MSCCEGEPCRRRRRSGGPTRPVGELSAAAARCALLQAASSGQQGPLPEMTLARGCSGACERKACRSLALPTAPGIIPTAASAREEEDWGRATHTRTPPRNSAADAAASEGGFGGFGGADRTDSPAPCRCSSTRDPPRLDFTRKVVQCAQGRVIG
jgi:hypothetical protein